MLASAHTLIFMFLSIELVIACSHTPDYNEPPAKFTTKTSVTSHKELSTGDKIANLAKTLLGSPYVYGGASPKGFDCSGLVYYTHGKFGIRTPRTSLQQYKHAKHIKLANLTSGDLVFFKLNRNQISHVGIYIGDGQFIHAPISGKRVAVNRLNDRFWKSRIVSGGRLY